MDQGNAVHIGGQPLPGGLQGGFVPVQADQASAGVQAADDLPRVARPAQGAVQVYAVGMDGQALHALVQQNGAVAEGHIGGFVSVKCHGL